MDENYNRRYLSSQDDNQKFSALANRFPPYFDAHKSRAVVETEDFQKTLAEMQEGWRLTTGTMGALSNPGVLPKYFAVCNKMPPMSN
jgi:hypothetical protein